MPSKRDFGPNEPGIERMRAICEFADEVALRGPAPHRNATYREVLRHLLDAERLQMAARLNAQAISEARQQSLRIAVA